MKKLDTNKLSDARVCANLATAFHSSLAQAPDANANNKWQHFKGTLYREAEKIVGHPKRRNADWFDDCDGAICELIQLKHTAKLACLPNPHCHQSKARFTKVKAQLQKELRQMENTWWDRKADEIQHLADAGDSRGFFQALKTVYGPQGA